MKKLFLLTGLLIGWFSFYAINASEDPQVLTIFEAVSIAGSSEYWNEQQITRKEILTIQERKIEEQKTKHTIDLGIAGMKDEVADSRDVESQETQTSQLYGSYQQTFENGAYWKLRQIVRSDDAIDEDTEDTSFLKTVFSVNYPIWGKRTNQSKISNQTEIIQWKADKSKLKSPILNAERETAFLYIDILRNSLKQTYYQTLASIYSEQYQWQKGNPGMKKDLRIEQLKLQTIQYQDKLSPLQIEIEGQIQEMLFLLNRNKSNIELVFPNRLLFPYTQVQVQQFYLQNNEVLIDLDTQLRLLEKDLVSKTTANSSDLAIGADIGTSSQNDNQGSNYKLYLNYSYEFWNGNSEQARMTAMEIGVLKSQIIREQKKISLQALSAFRKLKQLKNEEASLKKIVELAAEILEKNESMFQTRDVSKETLFENRLSLVKYQFEYQQSYLDYWEHLIELIYDSGMSLNSSDLNNS